MHRWQLVLGLVCWLAFAGGLLARPVDLWSEERLWKEADLVVIGTVKASADARADHSNAKPDSKIDVHTVFTVDRVLQGKLAPKIVAVRHHRYFAKEAEIEVVDGPAFVEFNPQKQHQYLMFLKRVEGEDELYEPVTGQYDPWQSFVRQAPYHVTNER